MIFSAYHEFNVIILDILKTIIENLKKLFHSRNAKKILKFLNTYQSCIKQTTSIIVFKESKYIGLSTWKKKKFMENFKLKIKKKSCL